MLREMVQSLMVFKIIFNNSQLLKIPHSYEKKIKICEKSIIVDVLT
jgi:hypothetical protein